MADLYTIAHQYRRKLLRRDAEAAARMMRLYSITAQRIELHALTLALQMEEAISNGQRISPSWLFQNERMKRLRMQVENEIARFADDAAAQTAGVQREFAYAGAVDTQDLLSFARLPAEAAIDLVGFASDGSPLAELFNALGPTAAEVIQQEMFAGMVRGIGARQLAREIKPALAGNMARALLIARTESLRAYRESSQRFYRENDDVVRGWRWVSACNTRACPMCWAMHGSLHQVDEQFVSHPGCRCTPVPVTDLSPTVKTGPARFAALPAPQQLMVLGAAKHRAYASGQITLQDLVGTSSNKRWGMSLRERSLKDARANPRGDKLPQLPNRRTQRREVA